MSQVTKPAPAKGSKEPKAPKVKVAKTEFIKTAEAKPNLNKDGLISSLANFAWNPKSHKGLRKTDFADQALYMEFQASRLDVKAAAITAQATKLRKDAELARTVGTPEQRRKVAKLIKMRDAQAALMAELSKEGVDISTLNSVQKQA